ncbi:hypothetical protein [Zobellella iuensis]|uniref:DUF3149 domain-containing protein n=1 Tax=Zobellella iuensis TaxID=2803811 RepID=A0ABS1QS06_9GAMM|nr:hypothetical protein [Zobellella iuensis]MBL1377630.1 hypothetical protein [Zobellella iuensis]
MDETHIVIFILGLASGAVALGIAMSMLMAAKHYDETAHGRENRPGEP